MIKKVKRKEKKRENALKNWTKTKKNKIRVQSFNQIKGKKKFEEEEKQQQNSNKREKK